MKINQAVKVAVGLALLIALVYWTGWRDLLSAFSQITLRSLFTLALLSFLLIFVSAYKWRLFLQRLGNAPGLGRLCSLYLVGYFVNLIMPSYVGGDVVRSMYAARKGERHEAFSATFLERYTGLVAMVAMAGVAVFIATGVPFHIKLVVAAVALALLIGSVFAFSSLSLWFASKIPSAKLRGHINKIHASLVHGLQDPFLLGKAGILSLLFHVLTIVNTVAVAYAIGWNDPPIFELSVVVPLILLIGAIPVSPQGLGIQEGAFFYFLQAVGARPEQAMAIGLVLRAKSYVLAILGGFVWIVLRRETPLESPPAATDTPTAA